MPDACPITPPCAINRALWSFCAPCWKNSNAPASTATSSDRPFKPCLTAAHSTPFNPTQLSVLKLLSQRAAETIITLTGEPESRKKPKTCREGERNRSIARLRRFTRALQAVSQTLDIKAEALPETPATPPSPALACLEANLFVSRPAGQAVSLSSVEAAVSFIEAQNRTEETRAALRWLKARLVRDSMDPPEVALIARDPRPYQPSIEEIAVEFGLTLHWREGLNLSSNPVIAALMSLLALPVENDAPDHNWSRRPLIDAWRSPYFENLAPEITPRHADHLDTAARQGLVIQGLDQWRAALTQLVQQAARRDKETPSSSLLIDEAFPRPERPTLPEARALQSAFETFAARITPPPQAALRQYAAFVEDLIGDDPKLIKDEGEAATVQPLSPAHLLTRSPAPLLPHSPAARSLGVVNRVWAVDATAPRDIAALRAFKDALRGLVLAEASLRQSAFGEPDEEITDAPTMAYAQFYEELQGAVQGATYYLPPPEQPDAAIPALSVLNARGLSFRAAALIGLAEGEFPRREREDVLLREEDRRALQQAGLAALETRLRGDEITLFYHAATRAREKLLLCRPYLADDGQKWEPSPYWEETHRLVGGPITHIRPEDPLPLSEVASLQELARSGALSRYNLADLKKDTWLLSTANAARLLHSAAILQTRLAAEPQSPFEGDLGNLAGQFSNAYGPDHVWSSSRLEAYGLCPLHFWLGQDLALETRQPPEEGFDVFSLGSMYHEILEDVYRQVEGEKADSEHLLALLPPVAKKVFDKAPKTYGFRPTPLWEMQRRELEQIVAQTLEALAKTTAGSTPLAQELVFGLEDQPPLLVRRDNNEFRVRGYIDRVDQDPDGRLRIIDYKSGSAPIAARDLSEGRRLQIALYALAARDALGFDIADGFYWHIGSAKASSLQLGKFAGGVEGAKTYSKEKIIPLE
ncbi:MAG: hypothetical protein B6243_11650 [Anaerolineaceae bacterium 4572_5.2]|nr:MAG: hypothetical protein B6243_11650 [Anaerolineaceae bacterium 4572_5.2]